MSIPASLKGGPITTNTLFSKNYLWFHIIIIWLSLLPVLFFIWFTWPGYYNNRLFFFLTLPFYLMCWYLLLVADTILISKFFLMIVNLIHKPREGYFPRDDKNRDYRFWSLRATIKKFALWVTHNCPLPWLDIIAFKIFGVKVGKATLFDAFVDVEFIEIGNNAIIGQGSVIMSTMITKDWLIIKKVIIGNDTVIGAHSVVSPGTIFGNNTVLGAMSATTVGQVLESDWVYMGVPCRKYKTNVYQSLEESAEELARKRENFKQYLTIEDIEEIERQKWKERREKRRKRRKSKKYHRKLERQEKKLEKLQEKELQQINGKKRERVQEKIEKKKEKGGKIKERIDILTERSQKQTIEETEETEEKTNKTDDVTE
ncbi:MAG: acyltransferase [Promethearchaeota archaeon]